MFGGVGINPQIDQLRRGVDIVVATPGRLLDHLQQKTIDLSHVEILVLDEADRMLDMGFIRDIRRVLAVLPRVRQNLLFSATFSDEIKQARRRPARFARDDRSRAAQHDRRARDPEGSPGRSRQEARTAHASDQGTQLVPGARLHAHQARREPPGRAARQGRHQRNGDPRQQEPVGTYAGTRRVQGHQPSRYWSRPISPRAGSISTSSSMSSTTTCPTCPKTMSTESAGRAGRARRAKAVSLVCVDEHQLLADIEKLIKTLAAEGSRAGLRTGSDPEGRADPAPQQRPARWRPRAAAMGATAAGGQRPRRAGR